MKKIAILLFALLALNGVNAQSCLPEGITFSTQAQINNFRTNYPNCTLIEGNVTIFGYNITNLNGLNVLTSIGGNLNIECNDVLTGLGGLINLTYIGGDLYISGNLALTNLTGLEHVTSVGGNITLANNVALTSISGLTGLSSVDGMLWIDNNKVLTSLSGLDNVASVAGIVEIFSNDALGSLTGLESMASISGSLFIGGEDHLGGRGNPSLTSLNALMNLNVIGGSLEIGYNSSLSSLAGLDNIGANSITALSIFNNEILSTCEVQSICNYLGAPLSSAVIHDNAPGCNSPDEVSSACILLSGAPIVGTNPVFCYPNPAYSTITVNVPHDYLYCPLSVLNLTGRELIRVNSVDPSQVIDVSKLSAGIYFLKLYGEKTVRMEKFIKE